MLCFKVFRVVRLAIADAIENTQKEIIEMEAHDKNDFHRNVWNGKTK